MMLRILMFISLVDAVLSGGMHTSLCCCGCDLEPCPRVGPSCPPPQQECDSPSDLQCIDLQRLWEDSHGKERSMGQECGPNTQIQGAFGYGVRPPGGSFRRLADQQLTVTEFGDGGRTTWKETVVPVDTDRPTFEKMETMINELQQTLQKVKHDLLGGSTTREPEPVPQMENGADPVTEDMERRVIDDVIERMRASSRRSSHYNRPMNEIDSSVSAAIVDVPAPTQSIPANIRYRRAAENGTGIEDNTESVLSGNCNDRKLRELIVKNIDKDAPTSKRAIQKAAEKELGGTFDVICSPCEFSFVISSQKYCDGIKDQVACFAFLQPPTALISA